MVVWQRLGVPGQLLESARWLEGESCFQWVDILTATAYRWKPGNDVQTVRFDTRFIPLLTPACEGKQVLADGATVYDYTWRGEPRPRVTLDVGDMGRLNDGVVAPDGSVWVGSMALSPSKYPEHGKLWRIDTGGAVVEVLSGIGISNGIVWRDARLGYYVDSLHRVIDEVVWDGSRLKRRTISTVRGPGEPDGIALHGDRLWIAVWDAGELQWINLKSGEFGAVAIDAVRPTSLAFSADVVLVTTAGRGSGTNLDMTGDVLIADLEEVLADA